MDPHLRTALIVVVTLVWAANFTAPIFVVGYTVKPEINVVFMAILGVLTASGVPPSDPPSSKEDDSHGPQ